MYTTSITFGIDDVNDNCNDDDCDDDDYDYDDDDDGLNHYQPFK